jgi:hypothetical protein
MNLPSLIRTRQQAAIYFIQPRRQRRRAFQFGGELVHNGSIFY